MRRLWAAVRDDQVLKRLLRNSAYLYSAHTIGALTGLLTLAVMTRALGPAGLGIVALIEAYVRSVDQLFRLETWQAVVRFGALALEEGRRDDFGRLIKFSVLLDLFGSWLATAVTLAGLNVAASWLELDQEQTRLAMWFSMSTFFTVSSTSTAVMRLFNKFDVLARIAVVLAVGRLFLTFVAWQLNGELWSFILIMAVMHVAEQLSPLPLAWLELRRHSHGNWLTLPLNGIFGQNRGLIEFLVSANVNVTARLSTQRFDTLFVGGILGPAATGLYHLAKRVGLAALRLGRPIQQAIYPDIARLWARGDIVNFRRIVIGLNLVIGAIATLSLIILAFHMEALVRVAFGSAFVEAAPLVTVRGIAVTLFLSGITLTPALLSMGAHRALAGITIVATIAFFASLIPLIQIFGALGANFGHVLFNLIWSVGCLSILLTRCRAKRAEDTIGPPDRVGPSGVSNQPELTED